MHVGSPRLILETVSLSTLLARAKTLRKDLLYHSAICHLASRFISVVSAWPSSCADFPQLAVRSGPTSSFVGVDMAIQLVNSAIFSVWRLRGTAADLTSRRGTRR